MITISAILSITFLVGLSYSLGYISGKFYNNGVTRDYLTEISTQVSNKIIRDIRGGLNGVRNAVDNNIEKTVGVEDYMKQVVQAHINAIETVEKIDLSNFISVEFDDYLLDPKSEIYHNQEVRVSNQNEKSLRMSIDSLWQRAYRNCLNAEEAYNELAKVHKQLTAVILKAKNGGRM